MRVDRSKPEGQQVTLNDADREDWVNNDAALYGWWQSSGQGMRAFVRANRAELDKHITAAVLKEPAR